MIALKISGLLESWVLQKLVYSKIRMWAAALRLSRDREQSRVRLSGSFAAKDAKDAREEELHKMGAFNGVVIKNNEISPGQKSTQSEHLSPTFAPVAPFAVKSLLDDCCVL